MPIYRTSTDLADRAALKTAAYSLFASYTWAGGPTKAVGRLLADGEISVQDAERTLLSGILGGVGITGAPPRALAESVAAEIIAEAASRTSELAAKEAALVASKAAQEQERQDAAREQYLEQLIRYPPVEVLRGGAWPASTLAQLTPEQRARLPQPSSVAAVVAPITTAPTAREEVHMSMLNAGLKTVGDVLAGAAGAVVKVAEAAAPALGSVLASAVQQSTAPTAQMGFVGPVLTTAGRVLTSPAGAAAAAGAAGAVGSWLFGEGGPEMFRAGAARARPVPRITVQHPETGECMTWVYAGRPILYSRDLAVVRRVNRIAARASRSVKRARTVARRRKRA
jgi:hypothetical protein